MKKALMVSTVPSMIGQFNMDNVRLLQELGYEVYIACNFNDRSIWPDDKVQKFAKELEQLQIPYYQIDFSRSPYDLKKDIISYKQLNKLLNNERFDLIHCHAPLAAVVSRVAAHKQKIKVMYTVHGFHFYDGAPLKNWIMFYPVEKFLAIWTDVLITINREDYERAKRKFKIKRIEYIPGVGIETAKFYKKIDLDKKNKIKMGVDIADFVIVSIGELNTNKNHEVVLRAIAKMKNEKIKYFICGTGNLKKYLSHLVYELDLQNQVYLLGYRNNISDILQLSDCFVHSSLREGLPVSVMEAMASGLPVIASDIRGCRDLIKDGAGGYLFDPLNAEELAEKIKIMISSESIRKKMGAYNINRIRYFDKTVVYERMKEIYDS